MLRIKMALDEVRVPVTLSNTQKELIYMNAAAQSLWDAMSSEIATRIPDFTLKGMYGKAISRYLETEEDRIEFVEHRKEPKMMFVNLGGKKLRLTIISVYDENNNYAGRATQWKDITAEVAIQNQISRIVEDAISGNFRNQVNISDKSGFFRELADGLNALLETCEKSYNDIADIFNALSHGDLTHKISSQYTGEFETIKNNANNTVDKLTEIVEQIKLITSSVNSGSKEIVASNNDLSKRTTSQASTLEETAEIVELFLKDKRVNVDYSKGLNKSAIIYAIDKRPNDKSQKIIDLLLQHPDIYLYKEF